MKFNRRAVDTPHPSNINLDFGFILDFTDDSMVTLNGSDISEIRNKRSSSYMFSQTTAVNQPKRNGKEAQWDDPSNAQWLDAGSDYWFVDAPTPGAFIFALVKTTRTTGTDSIPFVFDFGAFAVTDWGLGYWSDRMACTTPTSYGGVTILPLVSADTGWRVAGLIFDFGNTEKIYLDDVEVASQAITLLDLRDAYIANASERSDAGGPMVIGTQCKEGSDGSRSFRDGSLKCLVTGKGIPSVYQRGILHQYFNALEAA